MTSRFELFGLAHLAALGGIAVASGGLVALARRPGWERRVRGLVSVGLVASVVGYIWLSASNGGINPWHLLPLHLCDMAILVGVFALVSKNRDASELLFFWTATGTLLASIMPAVRSGFPSGRFVTYFLLHGGVIVAAMVLTFGAGLRPRRGAHLRALAYTNLYAIGVAGVNLAFDKNYLFLMAKPRAATLLDYMGPWPVYIIVAEVVALVLFTGLYVAARRLMTSSGAAAPASRRAADSPDSPGDARPCASPS